jgi:hypothetical protein
VDAELLELMPHTVVWIKKGGSTLRGEPLDGERTPIQCLYDEATSQVADFDGRTVNTVGTVYCDDVYQVEQEHRIEVPDGTKRRPVRVRQLSDDEGPYSTVVWLGA